MTRLLYILFSCMVFSSCGIYLQNTVNVTLMEHAGQLQIAAHESLNGPEGQASYSITKDIGVIANYQNKGEKRTDFSAVNYEINKHYFGEAGLGLYEYKVDGSTKSYKDVFFLAGQGMTSRYVQGLDSSQKNISVQFRQATYNRFCVQGDFAKTFNKYTIAFSPRLFLISYFDIIDSTGNSYKKAPNMFVRADFALTSRYHFTKNIAAMWQTCITLPLMENGSYDDFSPFNFSVGLNINLNLFKEEDKTKSSKM
jgi:hypothetical protein